MHINMEVHLIQVCIKEKDFKLLARYNTQPKTRITNPPATFEGPQITTFLGRSTVWMFLCKGCKFRFHRGGIKPREREVTKHRGVLLLPQNTWKPLRTMGFDSCLELEHTSSTLQVCTPPNPRPSQKRIHKNFFAASRKTKHREGHMPTSFPNLPPQNKSSPNFTITKLFQVGSQVL